LASVGAVTFKLATVIAPRVIAGSHSFTGE
jgi:hypothetical protein